MKGLDKIWNKLIFAFKEVTCDSTSNVTGKIYIHGKKGGVTIGNNCILISESTVNPTSGFSHCYFRTEKDGFISIGNNVGISHTNITSFVGVTIEDNVLIGSGVKIWDTDFHSVDYTYRSCSEDSDVKSSPILIKEGAFIGACSIILKGVTIGRNSVIGAGSVVTKSVPDNEIWAGNPAKFVRKLGGVYRKLRNRLNYIRTIINLFIIGVSCEF